MLQTRRISAKHYYDYLPELPHKCGDIWSSLPTNGLLGQSPSSGIVITPACDLANRKAETIIYLPIISVTDYFVTPGALPDLKERMAGLFQAARLTDPVDWQPGRYRPPSGEAVDRGIAEIKQHLIVKQRGAKEIDALERALAGLAIIRRIADPSGGQIGKDCVARVFGKDWERIKSELVTNSYRTDLHFLPRDEQEGGFAGLASHSLALFRYPITAPIEVLDLAQVSPDASWQNEASKLAAIYPAARAFSLERPVKVLSLKTEFLSDLLSRYCAVYSRLGSPDFTPQTVARIGQEVDL